MQTQMFNNVVDFSRLADAAILDNALAATKELVEINGRLMERYLENQIGLANLCVEGSEKQMQVAGHIANPQEYAEKQTALYEEYRDKFSEVTGRNFQLVQDAGEEYVAWFKRNLPKTEVAKPKAAKAANKPAVKKAAV